MALATTTLSAAVAVNDNSITVASATSVAAGRLIRIDDEFLQVAQNYVSGTSVPVLRGRDGTVTAAHASSANVTHGAATDFVNPPAQVAGLATNPRQRALPIFSYSAAGAIAPVPGIHVINGTGALAMTLASPTKDMDGELLIIVANGKAAHTVTYSAGFGAGTTNSDVATFSATFALGFTAIAINGVWVVVGSGLLSANTPVGLSIA
jgi:hypothetical protein